MLLWLSPQSPWIQDIPIHSFNFTYPAQMSVVSQVEVNFVEGYSVNAVTNKVVWKSDMENTVSELHDTSFVDRLLEKVSGSSSKCTGKPIALPKNWVKDSRMTLMGTLLNWFVSWQISEWNGEIRKDKRI